MRQLPKNLTVKWNSRRKEFSTYIGRRKVGGCEIPEQGHSLVLFIHHKNLGWAIHHCREKNSEFVEITISPSDGWCEGWPKTLLKMSINEL